MDPNRLTAIPIFSDLSPEEANRLATFATETSAAEGQILMKEGDYSVELIAIEEGTADVIKGGHKIASLKAGDLIGEMGLLEHEPRSADVIASSPMRLLKLTHWEVRRMSHGTVDRIKALIESGARPGWPIPAISPSNAGRRWRTDRAAIVSRDAEPRPRARDARLRAVRHRRDRRRHHRSRGGARRVLARLQRRARRAGRLRVGDQQPLVQARPRRSAIPAELRPRTGPRGFARAPTDGQAGPAPRAPAADGGARVRRRPPGSPDGDRAQHVRRDGGALAARRAALAVDRRRRASPIGARRGTA